MDTEDETEETHQTSLNQTMISIIIPVYKTAATLDRCVDSIATQEDVDYEIILVDDGSPDDCPTICDRRAAADKRIRVVHKPNGGLSSARNAGIDAAHGDILMFIDSDDYIEPGTLHDLSLVAEEHPEYDMIEFPVCRETADGEQIMLTFENNEYRNMNEYWLSCRAYNHAYAWNKMYRRRLFDDIRYPDGMIFEDMHILPRLLRKAKMIATTCVGLYHYCWNSEGISNNADGKAWRSLLKPHLRMLKKTRCDSVEWANYYMQVLNIQIYTCQLTGDKPQLPTIRQNIMSVDKNFRLKALLLDIMGVNVLCRANRMLRSVVRHKQHK